MSEESKTPTVKANDSNILATVSYLGIFSVVIYALKKDDSYVVFHAKQGMVLFGILVASWVMGMFLWVLGPIFMLVDLAVFVGAIIGMVKAYQGERFEIPVIGEIAKKLNF